MTLQERLLMVGIMLLFIVPGFVVKSCEAGDDIKYHVTFMPVSLHHNWDEDDLPNERHNGIGVAATFPGRLTLGAMYYNNSYHEHGWIYTSSYEFVDDCELCFGIGGGYAPEYTKDDVSPVLGWVQVRLGYVTVLHVPAQVTTMVISFPLK